VLTPCAACLQVGAVAAAASITTATAADAAAAAQAAAPSITAAHPILLPSPPRHLRCRHRLHRPPPPTAAQTDTAAAEPAAAVTEPAAVTTAIAAVSTAARCASRESGMMPELPVEVWAYIYDIIDQERLCDAATVIQARYRAYAAARMVARLRSGLSYLMRYIRKGINEVSALGVVERQAFLYITYTC
jgi:pyruvate/2-oxoglutarate dehydrogenase complex dihydrolipoamide acyltransferase (E2) component